MESSVLSGSFLSQNFLKKAYKMEYLKIIGSIITLAGSLFILLAAIGLLRMPDVYNRIQAGTKATTLGTILTLSGIGLIHTEWLLKVAILIIFVVISNPVSSHVLGRAAHFTGVPLARGSVVDKLADDQKPDEPDKEAEL